MARSFFSLLSVKTAVVAVLLCLLIAYAGQAQTISSTPLTITSATLQDGQAGIETTSSFEFTFSRQLPFSSIINPAFRFEPRRLNFREEFFFGGERTVRFRIRHEPNTDYVAYAFGALACNSSASGTGCFSTPKATTLYLQSRPYVVNYTTAPTAGNRQASGSVTFGDVAQPPAKSGGNAALLRDLVEEAFSETHHAAAPQLFSSLATDSLQRTVVFLLDAYTFAAFAWTPRAGAAPDVAGAFSMQHVREGTYWPIAVHFADRFGMTIARLGYHDANGDFDPDPVVVGADGVSDLKIVLMPDEPILARQAQQVARLRAARLFPDAELVSVMALNAEIAGHAAAWRYAFYSPAADTLVTVDAGSFNTQLYTQTPDSLVRTQQPLPENFVDSNVILQQAETDGGAAFRANFEEQALLNVALGDLPLSFRPAPPARFWHVLYEAPPMSGSDSILELFYDAVTGARLDPINVASDAADAMPALWLAAPAPNPVRQDALLTYAVQQSSTVHLAVYDLLGRNVQTLVDAPVAAGTHTAQWDASALPSGTYLLRLTTGGRSAQQMVTVVR